MDHHIWPFKSRTTSLNIHTAALWGYELQPWKPARGDERWGEEARERGSGISVLAARHDDIYKIIMTRKSGKHLRATYGTPVSILSGLLSSIHRNLHHWRSNQQPQYAEAENLPLGHRFMSHISGTELTIYIWLVGCVLWQINPCRLFKGKSGVYISIH